MERDQFYWDSNAFLGFLNGEADKADVCELVLRAARNGTVVIVTSALTLTEVLFIKGQQKLDPSKRSKVDNFFKSQEITVRNVTRQVADLARAAVWDAAIKPKDALHIATACQYKVPVMHTFDEELIGKSGIALAGHRLKISKPEIIHQTDWVNENPKQNAEGPGDGSSPKDAQYTSAAT
jgi:predicted nucleic acid-binding protein